MKRLINFPALERPIELAPRRTNVLQIDDRELFSRVVFAAHRLSLGEDVGQELQIFREDLSDEKNFLVAQNPLAFNFAESAFAKALAKKFVASFDLDEKIALEQRFEDLRAVLAEKALDEFGFPVALAEDFSFADLLKFMKIRVLDDSATVFEKCQNLVAVAQDLAHDDLLILCGFANYLTPKQFASLVEEINLDGQTALFLENAEIDARLDAKIFQLDADFCFWEK